MPAGAVCFDVDGTLVPETSSSQFLAARLGHLEDLADAEDAYARGELDNFDVSVLDVAGWAGSTRRQIDAWLEDLPLVAGIQDVVDWCRRADLVPIVATLAWSPVGDHLVDRFGFHSASGPVPAIEDDRYSGRVDQHLDEYGKRDIAIETVEALGLSMAGCASIGDSRSDLPLFRASGLTIAFNASPALQEHADVIVDGHDLRSVLPALRHWHEGLGST